MAKNVYETLFILDSNRYARDPGGVSGSITEMIEGSEGNVLASRLWNEQKLAYPIEGHQKGTYWLTYFEMDSRRVDELNRKCQLNEAVVRQLTLKIDPRLAEPMVAHARGEAAAAEREEEGAASEPEATETATANS